MPTPPRQISKVVIRFAGDSGDGMQLTGGRFGSASARAGNDIATLPDFPAEIRAPQGSLGGVSSFQIHVADHDIVTPGEHVDVLVAMNPAALKVNLPLLRPGGLIITDVAEYSKRNLTHAGYQTNPLDGHELDSYQVTGVDLTALTRGAAEEFGLNRKAVGRTRNMLALGMCCWAYSLGLETTLDWLHEKFASNAQVRDANIAALRAGYAFGETIELTRYEVKPATLAPGLYRQVSGNQATAFGLVTAAKLADMPLFLGAYPITPASDLLHDLSRRTMLGVHVFQAEDEIAAVGAALGASFGGSLGVATTSGPGFSLKQETINLAVMTELPLLVVDVQRAGPSTGMPTKTEQSDLMQALWGRNGDSPVPVIAAATPSDCFNAVIEAARIAVEYRTPVVFLSDAYLGNGSEPWRVPRFDSLTPIEPRFTTEATEYSPYHRDPTTLARTWAIPGTPGLEHIVGGLEKSPNTGAISYDPTNHEEMTRTRAAKIAGIRVPDAEADDPSRHATTLVVGWGSTYGPIVAACRALRAQGKAIAHVHLRHLNPMPANLGSILARFDRVVVPENNMGQLCHELRARYLVDAQPYTQIRGLPLSAEAFTAFLLDTWENR